MFTIEIAYAAPNKQSVISINVEPTCTVRQAIIQSGILEQYPEIDLDINKVGIFSKAVSLEHPLNPYDRIEIYRPLMVDPKQARHLRAKKS